MNKDEKIKYYGEKFLDEVRSTIILAGGREIPNSELRKMSVIDFLSVLYPNDIRLKVGFSLETMDRYIIDWGL